MDNNSSAYPMLDLGKIVGQCWGRAHNILLQFSDELWVFCLHAVQEGPEIQGQSHAKVRS